MDEKKLNKTETKGFNTNTGAGNAEAREYERREKKQTIRNIVNLAYKIFVVLGIIAIILIVVFKPCNCNCSCCNGNQVTSTVTSEINSNPSK